MLKSHDKFHSENGRRLILVADDEPVNRMLLGEILSEEFDVVYAGDGQEVMEQVLARRDLLSLVFLDLMMPKMSGQEVLRAMKSDPELAGIPVMVMTSDQASEIESLSLGASDFISKPFPPIGVILARVRRAIELSEDRQIIRTTERDTLTGLYNREYFYRYAEQFDHHHAQMSMDAIVIDINHFHMINERYGREFGNELLKTIGERVRSMVQAGGGIVCRREADTFLVYCPHRERYEDIFETVSQSISVEGAPADARVRVRMGIYSDVDKTIDMERRFDRAKMAADTIRNNYNKTIAVYDSQLHDSELYAEQLIDDFPAAIRERQFQVFYQPKFDVRGEKPILCSAEALVRWQHPKLGMINPGIFIPLFEENGMILQLDHYVWREAAAQIRDWKNRYEVTIPVSVNVSRVDMFDADLIPYFDRTMEEFGLNPHEYLLEITESAYVDDAESMIAAVNGLRARGFKIEMDDFGTGYSSLGMLSNLPIDALKLDMVFVRNAFNERQDVRMLELIMGIAEHLSVPVIAEGVETKEQMLSLKAIGCDIVQGYYFAKPLPAGEFDHFVKERSLISKGSAFLVNDKIKPVDADRAITYVRIAQALAGDYFSIHYVNMDTNHFVEFSADESFERFGFPKSGEDFFSMSRTEILRAVHEDDREMFLRVFSKENILHELEENRRFSMTFRMMFSGTPTYVYLKALRMEDASSHHIVIGVSNVDAQIRREQELNNARMAANRDPLTGVKSKHAFTEAEEAWNERIGEGAAGSFAVAVCDVNGLKEINDTQGHKAGDRHIQQACTVICNVFRHSPVYRVGGDEFVAILSGQDYERRGELIQVMFDHNQEACGMAEGGVSIACGTADFDERRDASFEAVFERADAAMYEDKKRLKQNRM